MEKFIVHAGGKLSGTVKISGAKNAALPILAAALLTKEKCIIQNVPPLTDVEHMLELLEGFGAKISFDRNKEEVEIEALELVIPEEPYELARSMRASFLVAGSLLGRLGVAKLSLPGGCQIGTRPVDLHLKGFRVMGVKDKMEYGVVDLVAKRLKGGIVYLDFPSVGATENIMMAAVLAKGKTKIENAAAEPEIIDLANFLRGCGAKISGDGTGTIYIEGVEGLHGCSHQVIPDRIEAGTFMVGAAMTDGDVVLEGVEEEHLKPVIAKLLECNVKTEKVANGLRVYRKGKLLPMQLKTMPYPGFPTDMQAQFMSLMSITKGSSLVTETMFENRFLHAGEMQRMGADIRIESRNAFVEGCDHITGSQVVATDLRGGAALILLALAAQGETEIGEIHHIERGYYHIEEKLKKLGVDIEKIQM
ncbi:UDP-N-acetylglucosamine 1-carboxyvinyltransferase [Chakrabartyella piscis]|uniref:UDP-N-acetylglucosamine 1-carboxyvinyltransferase n=1 Tax=Chakrabartyella piscis TaxID=2918914 RepID=UPI0029584210|nr:UDP-N-acetylglucosamine 1-carboxyvinyltransferase [Chakrabartyella piscis]